jgi:hypothetical protein
MSDKELGPNDIVRLHEAKRYFGYQYTQLKKKIAAGFIPAPIALSDDGRALGWFGAQVIEHQQRLMKAAEKRTAARAITA